MNANIETLFAAGLKQLNLSLDSASQQKLLRFLEFLKKWNAHYNLTAITDSEQMIYRHLLDSLSIVPYISGENILDLGSGAGFPGIPLAVYFPQKNWTLLDSNGKKTRFLIQAKAELSLPNITIVNARFENWTAPQPFDCIVIRAVGVAEEIMDLSRRHLRPGGQWLFMKGHPHHEQLPLSPPPVIHTLQVPGILEPRCVITIKNS